MNQDTGLTSVKKAIIITLMSIIAVFLGVVAIILVNNKDNSRTIMIYMSGNNLESNWGLATSDLEGIVPEKINLENTNVLLYTGGTKEWNNDFVSSNENAIFELTKNGFKKIKTYQKTNMGDSNTLSTFLNYSYDNYKTGRYDLIMWDHGSASMGTISDENTEDMLYLFEVGNALKNSRFNSNNKIETIVFRTCLNGTLEMASVLAPYADYMVASEELTRGQTGLNVLGFINNVNEKADGKQFGELFIKSYQEQMNTMNKGKISEYDSTYAIINLNNIKNLLTKMDSFFKEIDVNKNYNEISRVRSVMHQYAVDSGGQKDYDTIDLYELLDNLKIYSSTEAESLKTYLKNDVVVYNWSTNNHSNGLSIYFPYYGSDIYKTALRRIYDRIDSSKEYKQFINDFTDIQNNKKGTASFSFNNKTIEKDGKNFKIQLSKEEQDNFAKASYIVFRKESDGYFTPIYVSKDTQLDKKGVLSTKIDNNLVMLVDEKTNEKNNILLMEIDSNSKYKEYTTNVMLELIDPNIDVGDWRNDSGYAHIIVDDKDNAYLDKVYLSEQKEDGSIVSNSADVNLDNYTNIIFNTFRYNILDENGNYTTNWGSNPTKYGLEVSLEEYHLETTSLKDGEYYCVFHIFDVYNNDYYTNLISVN